MSGAVIETKNLKKYFSITGGLLGKKITDIKAVDDVDFQIKKGETFGLVGESGCGKTTLGRCLLKLLRPTGGEILFHTILEEGSSKAVKKRYEIAKIRNLGSLRKKMQIVHQDPFDSLNPRMLIKDIVAEPLTTHKVAKGLTLRKRVIELLHLVGLGEEHLYRYPHELSGGQLQRVCIARAIAPNPEFLVLDEPTSALDVSVQAQILSLLKDLQREFSLTYLFISHDISVIDFMSNRIGVMYLGKIVEIARKDDLLSHPLHPYTRALMSAIPTTDPRHRMLQKVISLEGDVPSPVEPPLGCRFHTRCPVAFEKCGWEARDFVNYLRMNPESLEISNLEFRPQGFLLEVVVKEGDVAKARDAFLELIAREKKNGNPLFKSIDDVKQEEKTIKLSMINAEEPPLMEVKSEHEVACFKYGGS